MDASEATLKEDTKDQQVTVQESCFYCIPRRLGIIFLAVIKLVLSLVLLLLLVSLLSSYLFGHLILLYYCIIWIAIIVDVFDVVFALAVLRGVCVKNKRIMKVYYVYGICIFGPLTFMCCLIVFLLIGNIIYLLTCIFIFFLIFMMQEYLNHLLKKEVLKMENSEHFRL